MPEHAPPRERWEQEILAGHRWGRYAESATVEQAHLRGLWNAARPVDDETQRIVDQIRALEICNWRLEDTLVALCEAIGSGVPTEMAVGHGASITEERWSQVWAYYAALRNWLSRGRADSYAALAARFDPGELVERHVVDMLGEPSELKDLYVERFCLCLERWLQIWRPPNDPLLSGHNAAAAALEDEIRKRDPEARILRAMRQDGDGRLQPCNHKAFRRYDIILSSIGCGTWRGAMPLRGTDGFERADLLATYLDSIEVWIEKGQEAHVESGPGRRLLPLLGEPDPTKRFLAALLVSLLRAQERSARARAESRAGKLPSVPT